MRDTGSSGVVGGRPVILIVRFFRGGLSRAAVGGRLGGCISKRMSRWITPLNDINSFDRCDN